MEVFIKILAIAVSFSCHSLFKSLHWVSPAYHSDLSFRCTQNTNTSFCHIIITTQIYVSLEIPVAHDLKYDFFLRSIYLEFFLHRQQNVERHSLIKWLELIEDIYLNAKTLILLTKSWNRHNPRSHFDGGLFVCEWKLISVSSRLLRAIVIAYCYIVCFCCCFPSLKYI